MISSIRKLIALLLKHFFYLIAILFFSKTALSQEYSNEFKYYMYFERNLYYVEGYYDDCTHLEDIEYFSIPLTTSNWYGFDNSSLDFAYRRFEKRQCQEVFYPYRTTYYDHECEFQIKFTANDFGNIFTLNDYDKLNILTYYGYIEGSYIKIGMTPPRPNGIILKKQDLSPITKGITYDNTTVYVRPELDAIIASNASEYSFQIKYSIDNRETWVTNSTEYDCTTDVPINIPDANSITPVNGERKIYIQTRIKRKGTNSFVSWSPWYGDVSTPFPLVVIYLPPNNCISQNVLECRDEKTPFIFNINDFVNTGGTFSVYYNNTRITDYISSNGTYYSLSSDYAISSNAYQLEFRSYDSFGQLIASKIVNYTITGPATLLKISSEQTTNILCNGAASAEITLTATNGGGSYNYSKDGTNWQTSNKFANLKAGYYTFYVRDGNYCIKSIPKTISQPDILSLSITSFSNVKCNGGNDGSVTLNAIGGTGTLSYSKDGTKWQSSNIFNGLTAGPYTFRVKDANNCTNSISQTISQPDSISLLLSVTNVNCNGGKDGSVTLSASGGITPYQYSKDGSKWQTDRTFTDLTAGKYTFSVKDSNNCSKSIYQYISQPSALSLSVSSVTNVKCNGGNDGSVTLSASGGTTPYQYSKDGSKWQTDSTFTGLTAGNYTFSVKDANNCSKLIYQDISQPSAMSLSVFSVTNVKCHGGKDGSVTLSASGGTGTYSYSKNGKDWQDYSTFTGLTAGRYIFSVKDTNGCTMSVSQTISQPSALSLSVFSATNVKCNGGNDGSVTLIASGGSGKYSYSKNDKDWQDSSTFTGLTAGSYTFSVKDVNGCTLSISKDISQPKALNLSVLSFLDVKCNGGNDGEVTLSASEGTGTYSYSNNGKDWQASCTFTGLTAGSYTLSVKDENGCSTSIGKSISQPNDLTFSAIVGNIACNGDAIGWIDANVSGGVPDYTFSWTGPNSYSSSSLDISNLNAGDYYLTVTDSNSCSKVFSKTISEPEKLFINISSNSDVKCYGESNGSVVLSGSGGVSPYLFSLNGTDWQSLNTYSNLIANNYTFYIKDSNLCTNQINHTVTQPSSSLELELKSFENVSCNGANNGSITLEASGGTKPYLYSKDYKNWQNSNTFSDLNAQVYTFYVKDSNNCEKSLTKEITEPLPIEIFYKKQNLTCWHDKSGTISVEIKGGIIPYSVTLKKNGETISTKNNISDTAKFTRLGAGIYSLEVTDGALCGKVVDNIQVLEPEDSLAASISAFSYPKCFGSTDGSIAIQARGGWEHFTYEINGEDHGTNWLFDSLGAGDYSIKVTDQNGCSKTLEQTLTEPTKLAISKKSSVDPKCYGQNSGQIQLGATGGTKSYEFRVGELTQTDSLFTGIAAGIHRCLVIDANSCKDSIEVTLSQPDPVGYSIDRSDYHGYDIACFGGTDSITITPSGGKPPYAIDFDGLISSLSGEGKTFNNLNATHSYNFTIEDSQGCTVSNAVNLSQPDKLKVSSLETTNATCFGLANGAVVADSIGGVAPYEFVLKNSKGVIVKQETGNSFACDSLPASDYSLDIMDANNCSISAAFSIAEPSILKATIAVTDVTCFGNSDGSAVAAVAGGTFPYIYQWLNESGNEVGTSATLSNVKASDYRVKITDSNGCSGVSGQTGYIEQVASIHNPPSKLAFTTDVTPVACNGGSTGVIKVKPTGGWGSYEFGTTKNSFTTNNSITGLASGWYKIYVRDSLSCIDSADVMVGEQTSLVIDNISFTDVTCNGGNDGTVQVTVSGGVPNYRYYLDGNEFSGSKDDLVARDYTITVKDANGCRTFGELTINQPEAISYTSEVKNSTCGLSDGYIKVNPSGGTGTLTVLWDSSGTVGNSLPDIKSGTYRFTITDGVGCYWSFSQSVSDEGGPDINLNNIANPLCYNGSDGTVSVEITSGTLPVKYKIYFEGIAKDSATINSLPFIISYNDLKQGEYNVTAVDFNGCRTDKLFTITSPTNLLVSTSKTDVKCKGELSGSAEAIVTGGTAPYTIQWFDSLGSVVGTGSQLSDVKAGTYTVKVIDANGCPSGGKTSTVEILEPQVELMLSIASKADVKCFGQNNGYVTLSASGGWGNYLYSSNDTAWQTSSTFDQLVAGDLNVYVKDRNGCKLSSTITINQNPPVEIAVSTTDITCFNANNGKIDIAATGGNGSYLYSINNGTTWNGSASFSNLQAGTYPIAAKDGNGCTVSGGNVNISEPDKLELQISGFTPLKCFGDADAAVELQATGGVSNYQFSKNSESFVSESSFIGLSAGSYTFNVKDGNECIATISKNIENPKKLSLSVSDYSDVSCYGGSNGSITLSATGGTPDFAFSINDSSAQPDATFGNLMARDYRLKVVDANGCEASVPKAISQPASPLTLSVANYSDVSCYGKNDGKVVLFASGGTYPYSYSMGNGTFVSTSTFTALVASSGYSFTAKDSKGCTATVSKAISEPDELLIASANVKDPTCFGYTDGKVDVTVNGGTNPYTYLWSNGSSLATTGLIKAGTYSLQVTDKNGCKYSQAFTLLNPEKISPTLPEAAIICSNQTLTLDAGYSGLSHKWTSDNGFASSDQVVTLSKAGNYYLTVTDSKGCFGVDAVHLITRDIEIEADFLLPDEASLSDTIVAIDISWPLPDSIKWVYHPDTFWQLNNTDWSVYLLPQQVGNHTVGIITYLMGCCATLDKTIAIGPYSENTKEITGGLSIIKDVQSYPNPSNGHFCVLVDLNSEAEVTLEIYAIYGKKITHETAKGQSHYKFDVNIRPIPGIYLLRISSGNEFKTFRMIVQ